MANESETANMLRYNFYTKADDFVVGTTYVLMALMGVVFNIIAIAVLVQGENSSKGLRIQLVNLAVADMLSAILYPPYQILSLLYLDFSFGSSTCKAYRFLLFGTFYASPLWNVAISLERFVAVFFPFKISGYTNKYKVIVAVIVWCCAFLPQITALLYAEVWTAPIGVTVCISGVPLYETNYFAAKFIATLKYVVPAGVITLIYALISVKLCLRRRIGEKVKESDTPAAKSKKGKRQVLVMLMVDAFVTLLTWLPVNITQSIPYSVFVESLGPRGYFALDVVLMGLCITNCFSSPVIYYIFNDSFRKDTNSLLSKVCCGTSCPTRRGGAQPSSTTNSNTTTGTKTTSC